MEKEDGVWRTIRGRRIFIRSGESLGSAMSRSGKFKRSDIRETKEGLSTGDRFNKYDNQSLGKRQKAIHKMQSKSVRYTNSVYDKDRQDIKNQAEPYSMQNKKGKTRVERNYDRYSREDRRELRHEELQKKLADYKKNKKYNDLMTLEEHEKIQQGARDILDSKFKAKREEQSKKDKINNFKAKKQSNNKVDNNYYKGTKHWGFGMANDDNIPVYNNNIDYTGDFTHANLSKVSNEDLQKIVNKQTELYNEASNRQVGDRRTYNGKKDQLFKDVETLRYSNGMKVAKEEIIRRENEKHPQYKGTDYEVKYASVKDAFNDPNSKINQYIKEKKANTNKQLYKSRVEKNFDNYGRVDKDEAINERLEKDIRDYKKKKQSNTRF